MEDHLAMFKRLCDKAETAPYYEPQSIDGDTTVMEHTRNAAYRAVDAMIAAVDMAYENNFPGTGKDPPPYIDDKVKKQIHRRIVNRTIRSGETSVKEFHKNGHKLLMK